MWAVQINIYQSIFSWGWGTFSVTIGLGSFTSNSLIFGRLEKNSKVETCQEIVNLLPYELFLYLSACPVVYVIFGD
jgi:hypothetical protein